MKLTSFKIFLQLLTGVFFFHCTASAATHYVPQKREFRGAWIQCVNGQFQGMSTAKMQQTLTSQLDELARDGVNAIFFRCAPSAMPFTKATLNLGADFSPGFRASAIALLGPA